jgi:hypothetical protein
MTAEEQQRMREALARADILWRQLLAERGGQPFGPVSEDIAAARAEWECEQP